MYKAIKTIMLPLVAKDDKPALRSFAVVMSCAFIGVFMLLLPWLFSHNLPLWPLFIAGALMGLHIAFPAALYYPYFVWMVIASILGWLNTKVILLVIFYLLITPIGVVMHLAGRLQYKHKVTAKSNWVKRECGDYEKDKKRLEEPF